MRETDLDVEEQARLAGRFTHSPTLQQAYRLREQLTAIFDAADVGCREYSESKINSS